MKRKIFIITGASGFIGTALCKYVLSRGHKVYAVLRKNSSHEQRFRDCLAEEQRNTRRLEIIYCSLSELNTLPEMITEPCDIFVHLGWANTGSNRNKSREGQMINVEYTAAAVFAAAKLSCSRFFGAGSQAEYGPCNCLITPSLDPMPVEYYGQAKLAAMKRTGALCRRLGLVFVWGRIFSVYGPNDKPGTMISKALSAMLSGEETAFTPGTHLWDYLYVEDMARAIYLSAMKGKNGAVYCLASGVSRPLKEFIRIMAEAAESSKEPGIGKLSYPEGPVRNLQADIESLKRDTGFVPAVTFEEGIRKTIEYMKTGG